MIACTRLAVVVAVIASGCVRSIHPAYESARDAALQPHPLPDDWQPDAELLLSRAIVDQLVAAVIRENGHLAGEVSAGPGARLAPDLDVTDVQPIGSQTCDACLGAAVSLEGSVSWSLAGRNGKIPVDAKIDLEAEVRATREPSEWVVTVAPREIRRVQVSAERVDKLLASLLDARPVRKWIGDALLRALPPLEVARLEGGDLPIVAVRPRAAGDAVRIDLRTAAGATPLQPGPPPDSGWALRLSSEAVVGILAADAYRKGPIDFDVVPVPTSVELASDRFELGLRLWRLKGKGWWRDYRVRGEVVLGRDRLELRADSAEPAGASKGAALVDPLAVLGRGRILQAIEGAVTATLPLHHQEQLAGIPITADIVSIATDGGTIVVAGTASTGAGGASPSPPHKPTRDEAGRRRQE